MGNLELIDLYRNDWKKKLHGNQKWMKTNNCGTIGGVDKRQFDCVMFVPQSRDSRLFNMNSEVETSQLGENDNWRIKVLEQSGTPLSLLFTTRFPNNLGCPRGLDCKICKSNDGVKCSKKSVVHRSWCKECENDSERKGKFYYVGETSRPYCARVREHEKIKLNTKWIHIRLFIGWNNMAWT